MMRQLIATLLTLLLFASPARAERDVRGYWLTEDRMLLIEMAACSPEDKMLCGFIRGMPGAAHDVELREHADELCGMTMIVNLSRNDRKNRWDGGKLLDPETEQVYDVYVKIKKNKLTVRAYIDHEVFGETLKWTQEPYSSFGCEQKSENSHD